MASNVYEIVRVACLSRSWFHARMVLNILISIFEKQFIVYGFIAKYQKNVIASIVFQFKIK